MQLEDKVENGDLDWNNDFMARQVTVTAFRRNGTIS